MKEIEKITSRDNRRLMNARRVRDGKEPDQIFVEGRRLVGEALRSSLEIRECFVNESFRDRELLDAIAKRTIAMAQLPEKIFDSIVDTKQPQGIALVAKRPLHSRLTIESRLKTAALPIVIYLKEVNNPSNLGAVLRTAEAADVAGIIISKNSADVFSPKAIRSSMGSSFRLPVLENIDFEEILQIMKRDRSALRSWIGPMLSRSFFRLVTPCSIIIKKKHRKATLASYVEHAACVFFCKFLCHNLPCV